MPKPLILSLASFGFVLAVLGYQVRSAERPTEVAEPFTKPPEVRPIEQQQPPPSPLRRPKIVVKKSQRQLFLFSDDRLVRTYRYLMNQSHMR